MNFKLLISMALACALSTPAWASTSSASSAAEAGSSTVGSLSDSLKGSSNSSSGEERHAQGRYRVTEVAQVQNTRTRLTLMREGAPALELTVPPAALAERGLQVGDAVQATPAPYGIAFAHADTGRPFFLALQDGWQRELASHVVQP